MFREPESNIRLVLSCLVAVAFSQLIHEVKPFNTHSTKVAQSLLQSAIVLTIAFGIVVKGELLSRRHEMFTGTLACAYMVTVVAGVARNLWRKEERRLVANIKSHAALDRDTFARLYDGAERAVLGEATLEAALAAVEQPHGVDGSKEWKFVQRKLLGADAEERR